MICLTKGYYEDMNKLNLSKYEISVFKAIAILCIMLHNFAHQLPNTRFLESERTFNLDATRNFYDLVLNGNDIFFALFSYLGHFGVALFVFMSGYGLVKKYENRIGGGKSLNVIQFIKYNAIKLWKLFVPLIVLCWIMYVLELFGTNISLFLAIKQVFKEYIGITLMQLTFTNTWITKHAFGGTWWYLALTFQLYLCYLIFNKWRNKSILIVFCSISCLLQVLALALNMESFQILMRWNFIGWLLPFTLGIWAARYNWIDNKWYIYVLSFVLFILTGLNKYTWVFQSAFLIVAIYGIKVRENGFNNILNVVGVLSPYLFITHSFIRNAVIKVMPNAIGCSIFVIISIIVAIAYKYFLSVLYSVNLKPSKDFLYK